MKDYKRLAETETFKRWARESENQKRQVRKAKVEKLLIAFIMCIMTFAFWELFWWYLS